MKNHTLIVLTIFLPFLGSCATAPVDTEVNIFLRPIHDGITAFNNPESSLAQLIDNDGNLYSTYWDIAQADPETFATKHAECTESLAGKRLFAHTLPISDFSRQQILPTTYIPFIKCLHAYGYKLIDKEAYAPTEYSLSFYRSHSVEGRYTPVGGNYVIEKQGVRYAEVYDDVTACEQRSRDGKKDGAIEESGDNFLQVSIESYLNRMKTCLLSRSYQIRSDLKLIH